MPPTHPTGRVMSIEYWGARPQGRAYNGRSLQNWVGGSFRARHHDDPRNRGLSGS